LTTFSLKMPSDRYAKRYSFSDFNSTQRRSGTYVTVSVAKSGSPVFGQIDVNSGIVMTISWSSGYWLGQVSSGGSGVLVPEAAWASV